MSWISMAAHGIAFLFMLTFGLKVFLEAYYYPWYFIRRATHVTTSAAGRHKKWRLAERELQYFFDTLDVRDNLDGNPYAQTDLFIDYLCQASPSLKAASANVSDICWAAF